MDYAGFWRRSGSIVVDILIFLPLSGLHILIDSYSKSLAMIASVLFPAMLYAYMLYFDARWGQSIGKMAMKIQIVKLNGDKISWNEAILRNSVYIALGIISMVGTILSLSHISNIEYISLGWKERALRLAELNPSWFQASSILSNIWVWSEVIVLLFNKKKRAIHDYIAGTVVIVIKPSDIGS